MHCLFAAQAYWTAFAYSGYFIMAISGIYKITSPTLRVYIGQSINIERRFKYYKRINCKNQTKLFYSLEKYGFDNHSFDIVEYCDIKILNERERYWQDFYNVLENGLNCVLTNSRDKKFKFSKESLEKIIKSAKGRKHSEETKLKISKAFKNHSEETIKKISESHRGFKHSEESKLKMSESKKGNKNFLGFKHSKETKEKISNALKKKTF
jgi:hypothetical protein